LINFASKFIPSDPKPQLLSDNEMRVSLLLINMGSNLFSKNGAVGRTMLSILIRCNPSLFFSTLSAKAIISEQVRRIEKGLERENPKQIK